MKPVLCLLGAAVAFSCNRTPADADPVRAAEFGIFFGGQVQKRDEIPFELDPAKQTQGFRVELTEPAARDRVIDWEVARPTGNPKGPRRVAAIGHATLGRGQCVVERTLPFAPGDPLGLWNIRVTMEDRVLLDRPFVVYDKKSRARSHPDAGTTIP